MVTVIKIRFLVHILVIKMKALHSNSHRRKVLCVWLEAHSSSGRQEQVDEGGTYVTAFLMNGIRTFQMSRYCKHFPLHLKWFS